MPQYEAVSPGHGGGSMRLKGRALRRKGKGCGGGPEPARMDADDHQGLTKHGREVDGVSRQGG